MTLDGYFDFNATAPVSASAREATMAALEVAWWNPSSLYRGAAEVRNRLELAREDVAELLRVEPSRVVFTSGATESNNAVMAWAAERSGKDRRCLLSAIEHPSVREPARRWFGGRVEEIPVDETGRIRLEAVEEALSHGDIGLVSVMAANNETGTLQPWEQVMALCRSRGVHFQCDAAQWIGKLPTDAWADCGFVTASAHKLGGPKGVGILVTAEGLGFAGQTGGPQEGGRRAGTENFPAVAGMAAAMVERERAMPRNADRARRRDRFEDAVRRSVPGIRIVAERADRLWNTSMLVLPTSVNLKWLTRLDRLGFQVSTGSACSAGKGNPSHVMAAVGLTPEEMGRVLRISGGWDTPEDAWLRLASALASVGRELNASPIPRKTSPSDAEAL